ncbi:unnamed protein product [Caenorhabditis auriculariae]|uniref:Uncharacterized protein n=1 Tax=Caenorhabditis auriculariae TaxID=2777116 RepID=A0A8S1HUF3_9PELO|nr:unnamed protein product [Caenorhabditis auriculariae]
MLHPEARGRGLLRAVQQIAALFPSSFRKMRSICCTPIPHDRPFFQMTFTISEISDQENVVDTTQIVEELMRTNEEFIRDAALKQATTRAINETAIQFENLVPLSFDQDQLVRQAEQKNGILKKK